jgi:glycosyltransferase involved in cell wall biosynthesis
VFVGRLSPEKGVEVLLAAWARLGGHPPLKIIGDGPLAGQVQEAARRVPGVEWLGRQPPRRVMEVLGDAAFLVAPSLCYETFGRTIIEAFARGAPVLASRQGAMEELVDHGRTGLLFEPGSPADLAEQVRRLLAGTSLAPMRRAARAEYERHYTAEANYEALLAIYRGALARAVRGPGPSCSTKERHA